MAQEKITPEDKLLKIIEKENIDGSGIDKDIKSQKRQLDRQRTVLTFKNNLVSGFKKAREVINLGLINKALIVLTVLVTFFSIVEFVRDKIKMNKKFELVNQPSSFIINNKEQIEYSLADVSIPLSESNQRNIFSFKEVETATKQVQISNVTSTLKLVGILWSKNPQAMVEDKNTNITHLLSPDDHLGIFRVKEITKDSILLIDTFGGELLLE